MGKQPLYTLDCSLFDNANNLLSHKQYSVAIRTVELREKVDGKNSSSFTIHINGTPVFAKGGNWVPADPFPSRIPYDKYQRLIGQAAKSGANMNYWIEMQYCIAYALCNRKLMMDRIKEVIADSFPDIIFEPMINIAHNYAAWEEHFGEKVIVHRKGAVNAEVGRIGIIPGSQGTKSYIVEGLGNINSFCSSSHG